MPRRKATGIFLHFSFAIFGFLVVLMVFFTVIKTGLHVEGVFNLWPYIISMALFLSALPAFALSRRQKGFPRISGLALSLFSCALLLIIYHIVGLGEDLSDMLYIMRFYYGMFILFLGFAAFLFWYDLGAQRIRRWILSLTTTVITLSFVLAAVEFFAVLFGLAGPESFWWVREQHVEAIVRYQSEGITEGIRAYGLASNSAVLSGFSLFLVTYYYSMVAHSLRLRNVIVLLLGIIPIFLSKAGTGLLLFVFSAIVIIMKGHVLRGMKWKGLVVAVVLTLAGAAIYSQVQESGRLTQEYWDRFGPLFLGTVGFLWDQAFTGWGSLFLGIMNLYQFSKPGAEGFSLAEVEVGFYDFGWIAFLIELGLVGVILYLSLYLRLVKLAFPATDWTARWSFVVLLLASFHYAVSFWVCSQVMSAIILAASIYVQWKESRERVGSPSHSLTKDESKMNAAHGIIC